MPGKDNLDDKIARVLRDEIALTAYDPVWPERFEAEAAHLRACLPAGLITVIEHVGSTAVPGLVAKPVVDMLTGVRSLTETRELVPPILEAQGYDYFWRPTSNDDGEPFYAWFIKRDGNGTRTHHLHLVEAGFPQWDMLRFREHLRADAATASAYAGLKQRLASEHPQDRVAYTQGKSAFIQRALQR